MKKAKNELSIAIEQAIFVSRREKVENLTTQATEKYSLVRAKIRGQKRKATNDLRPRKRIVLDKVKIERARQSLISYKGNTVDTEDFGLFKLKALWYQVNSRLKKQISFRKFKIKMANAPKVSKRGNSSNLYIEAAAWLVFPECWPDHPKNPPEVRPRFSQILKGLGLLSFKK